MMLMIYISVFIITCIPIQTIAFLQNVVVVFLASIILYGYFYTDQVFVLLFIIIEWFVLAKNKNLA